MEMMPFKRPTTHYDERVRETDEKICELIKKRKEISDNNPGYPPFEYISTWAGKYDLYEDLLKIVFGTIWDEKTYIPKVKPKGFRINLPVLRLVEIGNRLFSVMSIRQYSNSSIVNLNIDWDTEDSIESKSRLTQFKLCIDDQYYCRMKEASGIRGHSHHSFIIEPALPDNFSGIKLIFKEYNRPFTDKQIGEDIIIQL